MSKIVDQLINKYPKLEYLKNSIKKASDIIVECYYNGGKVLICGNGGSASDCEHIVGELMKQFILSRKIEKKFKDDFIKLYPQDEFINRLQGAVPAISLVSQTSISTAIVNDIGHDIIYAQQVYGYGKKNDVLIAISTSGNSTTVINAMKVAKVKGMQVIGMSGQTGGKMLTLNELCDILLNVPETETYKIQEYHLPIYHAICACVENSIWNK